MFMYAAKGGLAIKKRGDCQVHAKVLYLTVLLFANTIATVITCGFKIGYTGPTLTLLSTNHPSAANAPGILIDEMQAHHITRVTGAPSKHFISSPLGLVPKADGGWRRIHDFLTLDREVVASPPQSTHTYPKNGAP